MQFGINQHKSEFELLVDGYWHLWRTLNRTVGSEGNQEFEKTRFVPAINLANFLKTNVAKFAAICVKEGQKRPKGRFFAPQRVEIS